MEWFIMNGMGVRSLAQGLGNRVAHDQYVVHDECAESIEQMLDKIRQDDPRLSVTKRHLLAEQIVTRDLLPIIKFASPDLNELPLVLRLLAELCEPVNDQALASPMCTAVKQELSNLSRQVRCAFLDVGFVSKLFSHISELITEAGDYEMSNEAYDCIAHFLQLIRNVLYHSQDEKPMSRLALHGVLLCNGLASILIYCIGCHGRVALAVPVCQVLSLIYERFEWEPIKDTSNTPGSRTELVAQQRVHAKLTSLIVQLMQGSLSTLTLSLKRHEEREQQTDNYMPWSIAYFLQYVVRVRVPLTKIRGILSTKCVGYLVYQLSLLALKLYSDDVDEGAQQQTRDRMMLIFTALENILMVIMDRKLFNLNIEELKLVTQFYVDLVDMKDLWNIVLFYIQNFDVTRFPRSFLAQLVSVNHRLLTSVEFYNQISCSGLEHAVLHHTKQFANPKMMEHYTFLLNTYSTNTDLTNTAVFNMLCHICIDCNRMDLFYTPPLLRLLKGIADDADAAKEDVLFAKHVTQSFFEMCANGSVKSSSDETDQSGELMQSEQPMSEWTNSEESDLFAAFADINDGLNVEDTVEVITRKLNEMGVSRRKDEIVEKLRQLGIFDQDCGSAQEVQVLLPQLVEAIVEQGCEDFISWLHQELLTASHVKAMPKDSGSKKSPLCLYSHLHRHDYPIMPHTDRQSRLLNMGPKATQLLDVLGISYQSFNGTLLPFIPHEQTAGQLYTLAEKLKAMETATIEANTLSGADGSWSSEEESVSMKSESCADTHRRGHSADIDGNLWLSYMRNAFSSGGKS